jgi:hypothetical protein
MNYFTLLLIIASFLTTSCFKSQEIKATREDDTVRAELESDLKQLELDGYIIENQISIAQNRIQQLSISPKMQDIAKKDMYQKRSFLSQINQQIAYLKIKINNREKYFLENQASLTKEGLEKEHEAYLTNKEANPTSYPWRIPGVKKPPVTPPAKHH